MVKGNDKTSMGVQEVLEELQKKAGGAKLEDILSENDSEEEEQGIQKLVPVQATQKDDADELFIAPVKPQSGHGLGAIPESSLAQDSLPEPETIPTGPDIPEKEPGVSAESNGVDKSPDTAESEREASRLSREPVFDDTPGTAIVEEAKEEPKEKDVRHTPGIPFSAVGNAFSGMSERLSSYMEEKAKANAQDDGITKENTESGKDKKPLSPEILTDTISEGGRDEIMEIKVTKVPDEKGVVTLKVSVTNSKGGKCELQMVGDVLNASVSGAVQSNASSRNGTENFSYTF